MSPPSPRVTKACPDLACWTRFPLWENWPPGAVEEVVRPEHPAPTPFHPAPLVRALTVCWVRFSGREGN